MRIYIVGKYIKRVGDDVAWECSGVFDSKEKAEAACYSRNHFVAPLVMNAVAPREKTDFPGCYYPKAKEA